MAVFYPETHMFESRNVRREVFHVKQIVSLNRLLTGAGSISAPGAPGAWGCFT